MNYQWDEVLQQAERFHQANILLNSLNSELQIVSWTNGAFAIELYYKALACKLHSGEPKRVHNLKKLFDNFPQEVKQAIEQSYYLELDKRDQTSLQVQLSDIQSQCPEFSKNFEWNLEQIEKAFFSFRYFYEKRPASIVFYPELRKSILDQLREETI